MSAALGYCDAALPSRVEDAIQRLGLPARHAFDPAAALAAMGTDKKRRGRTLRFVLIREIGEVTVADDVPEHAVVAALERSQADTAADLCGERSRRTHHVSRTQSTMHASRSQPRRRTPPARPAWPRRP